MEVFTTNNNSKIELMTLEILKEKLDKLKESEKGFATLDLIGILRELGNQENLIKWIRIKGMPVECYYSKGMELTCLNLFRQGYTRLKEHPEMPEKTILVSWMDTENYFSKII